MNNKILIGSIIAVVTLLLMPSIPAIQQITIEDRAYSGLVEELDFKDVKEIKELEQIKHPLLNNLVIFLISFRYVRCSILFDIAVYMDFSGEMPVIEIIHPILFLRTVWLMLTMEYWYLFWNNISDTLGWNWELSY